MWHARGTRSPGADVSRDNQCTTQHCVVEGGSPEETVVVLYGLDEGERLWQGLELISLSGVDDLNQGHIWVG